jgi:hypothetical protein
LSVFIKIFDVDEPTKSSPAPRVISSLDNIPAVAVTNPVAVNVPFTAVLPVAQATVNLSVSTVIFEVEEATKSSPAHKITHQVNGGLPLTLIEPAIVTFQPTVRSSPTTRSSLSVKSSPSIT